jgi:hypothetical protein
MYHFPPVALQPSLVSRFGGDSTYALDPYATLSWPGAWYLQSQGRGAANGYGGRFNGPRWWAGGGKEPLADPNGNVCATLSSAGCVDTVGNANASAGGIQSGHINGALPGIQVLWAPEGYLTSPNPTRILEVMTSSVTRAADFKVYWNAGTAGRVDSVVDVTHNVLVPFSRGIGASWGILNDSGFATTPQASTGDNNNAFLTWTDIFCVAPAPSYLGLAATFCGGLPAAQQAFLMDHPLVNPMNWKPSDGSQTGGAALVAQGATGSGFIFYLNGKFFVMQLASTLSACCQNAVWNARFYAGIVSGASGSYRFRGATRPPAVPGLKVAIDFTGAVFAVASSDTLMRHIHTVPDPYYVTNSLETSGHQVLRFVNLPSQAIVRIYSTSGILVTVLAHNDPTGGGELTWDLTNRGGARVASGVYFYHVESVDGRTRVGRFTVINR